ncbi:MAG TPA: hypothetical protein VGH95_01020 [Candidatus Aquirickettsiella sp.]
MPFPSILKKFSENGFFELKNSKFSSGNIQDLEKNIEQLQQKPFSIPLRIRLKDIRMIPDISRRKHGSGPVIQHVPRRWADNYGDLAISQMGSLHGFNTPMSFGDVNEVFWHPLELETPLEALKKDLLSLLTQSWSSIELDQLFFCPYHQIDALATQQFYNELLKSLANNSALQKLSISPFSLSKQIDVIQFLANTTLEQLHLDITEADPSSWQQLCRILERHPTLKSLNFGNSVLDTSAYTTLADLLDKNYQIDIILAEPTDVTDVKVLNTYQALKKRLSKPGLERFKEKYLSQDKLLQIAIVALESLKEFNSNPQQTLQQAKLEQQFAFLLRSQASLAITDGNYTDLLHPIYLDHRYLINEKSPELVQLDVNTLPSNISKTIGCILLEKALEANNQKAIQTLLNANANLLEFPSHEEEPFLVKLLQTQGAIKTLVLERIHRDSQLEESDLFQLQLADGSKTVGYVLLKKALETQNLSALQNLLNAKADLFETPENEQEPFLVKVFQSPGELKKFVVDYIRRDSRLIALTSERLKNYSGLFQVFTHLKNHLDKYSLHLVKKDNPSLLMSIAYEALATWNKMLGLQNPSETRDKECAQIYKDLDESLKVINQNPLGVTYAALSEVQMIMHKMKKKSVNALRGIFNVSSLHDKAIKLVDEFDNQLKANKDQIFAQQNEMLKNQAEEIKQLSENRVREQNQAQEKQAATEAKLAATEIKLDKTQEKLVTVQTELAETKEKQAAAETQHAEIRAKQVVIKTENAEIKAENAEIKAENAEIKAENAEIKAQSAEIKKTLEILLKRTSTHIDSKEETVDPTTKTTIPFFRR